MFQWPSYKVRIIFLAKYACGTMKGLEQLFTNLKKFQDISFLARDIFICRRKYANLAFILCFFWYIFNYIRDSFHKTYSDNLKLLLLLFILLFHINIINIYYIESLYFLDANHYNIGLTSVIFIIENNICTPPHQQVVFSYN